jgi:hypothetical protein
VIRWYKKGLNIDSFFDIYPELKDNFLEQLNKENNN